MVRTDQKRSTRSCSSDMSSTDESAKFGASILLTDNPIRGLDIIFSRWRPKLIDSETAALR